MRATPDLHIDPVETLAPDRECANFEASFYPLQTQANQQIALNDAIRKFDPNLRLLWVALKETNGNQSLANPKCARASLWRADPI